MPWHVAHSGSCPASKPYAVIKDADSSVVACHETREKAMSQVRALYANEPSTGKAAWTSAYINDLPDSAFACPEQRKYPHHDASGKLDLPHLRAALSRVGDPSNEQCGKGHLQAHAEAANVGSKALSPIKATLLDDDAFRLLAIPFGGPIPSPLSKKGVDADFEWFSERTDIKPDWLEYRLVDFHHGGDPSIGRETFAKAKLDPEPDDDGWWVTSWADRQSRYMTQIKQLIERGVTLYGSSESIKGMEHKAPTGEILVWPYWRQTLSPLPRNTFSVLRPIKAVMDDLTSDYSLPPSAWATFSDELRNLGADLSLTSLVGEETAKSGRVLSSINEDDITAALEALLGSAEKVRTVLARAKREVTT